VTEVKEEPSTKREHQPFKVLATETLSHKALDADIYTALPTEKVDGTCCYITTYKGQPYLWARLDRKPNKLAEKRFKNYLQSKQNSQEFFWNVEEDFKPVPECWIPAKEIEQLNGNPMPDENGHIPGIMKTFLKCIRSFSGNGKIFAKVCLVERYPRLRFSSAGVS